MHRVGLLLAYPGVTGLLKMEIIPAYEENITYILVPNYKSKITMSDYLRYDMLVFITSLTPCSKDPPKPLRGFAMKRGSFSHPFRLVLSLELIILLFEMCRSFWLLIFF